MQHSSAVSCLQNHPMKSFPDAHRPVHTLPGQKVCRTLQKCGYNKNNQAEQFIGPPQVYFAIFMF